MKFTNQSYLKTLRVLKNGVWYEQNDVSKLDVKMFCKTYGIDPKVILDAKDRDPETHTIHIDFELYQENKERTMINNASNIGDDVIFVTPAIPRFPVMRVSRENIIKVAQWCGAEIVSLPKTGKWSLSFEGDTATIGDFILRDEDGEFQVIDEMTFREEYDRV